MGVETHTQFMDKGIDLICCETPTMINKLAAENKRNGKEIGNRKKGGGKLKK